MSKYSISATIIALAIIGVGISALAQKKVWPVAPAYVNPTAPEMPLIASYAFYDTAMLVPEKFRELRTAGFNMSRQSMNEEKIQKALEAIEGTGVKMMLYSWDALNPQLTVKTIDKYKDNPNIGAYHVVDEPKMSKFPEVKRLNDLMLQADPDGFTFSNLLPSIGAKQLEAPDYRTYVEEFVSTVNPPVISFDCYPVKEKNGKIYVYDRYFETLEIVADVAEKSGRPFFSYVLTTKAPSYPKQTVDFLRFQVFTALGYGAQGLSYFTYCLPDFDKTGEFSDSPLDREGNRTDVWYMVRDVNREIRLLEKHFLGAEVIKVSHTGRSIPTGTNYLTKLPEPFTSLTSNGEGVMVSHFKNNGREYLLLVNRDVLNRQKVNFTKKREITRLTGDGKETPVPENDSFVILSPGGYALYKL